jgi:para-nitrobenzyl esterase
VTNLLASPLASGMIARAAESSGGDHVKDPAQAEALTGRFLRELDASARQLRSAPAAEILNAQLAVAAMPHSTWIWRPSVDGVALTGSPLTAIASGSAARVPLLLQTCARECAMYALLAPDGPAQADRVLAGYFGQGSAAKILASYAARYPDLDEAALRTAVMTDERYVAPTERLADAQAAHGSVWRSRYDGPYSGLEDDPDPQFAQYAPLLRAAHGGDGAAIWQGGHADADDGGLPAALHGAWGAFATTGDPGWAPYAATGRPAMIFADDGPRVSADPFAHARDTWSSLDWQPGTWWAFDDVA